MNLFSRTELLIGKSGMEKLKRARVAVFGIGGVGGYAVEALVRSGIGRLELVDNDRVSPTNINRQIIALSETLGRYKTEAAAERARAINPECEVTCRNCFFTSETAESFDFSDYDYVIDAIDTLAGKIAIAKACQASGTPVVSCMGAGNKLDPTAFEVTDIYKTSVCPLARAMRKLCRENGIEKLKVVYSKEIPVSAADSETAAREEGAYKPRVPGSIAFVPSVAGLIAAGEAIKEISGTYGNGIGS